MRARIYIHEQLTKSTLPEIVSPSQAENPIKNHDSNSHCHKDERDSSKTTKHEQIIASHEHSE